MSNKPKMKPLKAHPADPALPQAVVLAARRNHLDPQQLLDWKVYPDGKVVLIAPNGMKLICQEGENDPDIE